MRMALAVGAAFLAAIVSGTTAEGWSASDRRLLQASGVVDRALIDALEETEAVRVVVVFDVAGAAASSRMATASDSTGDVAIRAAGQTILDGFALGEFELVWRFPSLGALAGRITRAGLVRLLQQPLVRRVGIDPTLFPQLAESVPLTRLDVVHALGFTGEGVTVAVIDSGIDTDHPDLADDLVGEECFCSSAGGCCPNGSNRQSGPGSAEDDDGHGTRVAGVITSRGVLAPPGAAPDVGILAIKATTTEGALDEGTAATDVLMAGNWVRLNRPDVRIANLSLATAELFTSPCDDYDAITTVASFMIDALREQGVAVFASAGNQGSGSSLGLPACLSGVTAVGAVYDADVGSWSFPCSDPTTQADQVTCFSNSDPTLDLLAPGAVIFTDELGGVCEFCVGTSFSAPMAASCAALLLQKNPSLTLRSLDFALRSSPTHVIDPKNGLSFPRLDCSEALASLPTCDDGEDNDGDGWIDHPQDPGCALALSDSENPQCDDDLDNDSDGGSDWDGVDLNLDGDFDDPGELPPDPECLGRPWRDRESKGRCGLGSELVLHLPALLWLWRRKRAAAGRRHSGDAPSGGERVSLFLPPA